MKLPPANAIAHTDARPFPGDESVVVTFRRITPHERVVISLNHGSRVGDLLGALHDPGVGVARWEGIEGDDGKPIPYSVDALNRVADASPEFFRWFNGVLLEVIGLAKVPEADAEKKDTPPSDGSTA